MIANRLTSFVLAAATILISPSHARAVEEPTGTCAAEPMDTAIAYGERIACDIGTSPDFDAFVFQGSTGDRIFLQTLQTSGDGDLCVSLLRPNGSTKQGQTCLSGATNPVIEQVLDQTGSWKILAEEFNSNELIGYTLSLERLVPAPSSARSICTGCSIDDEIAPAPDLDFVEFEASEGSRVLIQGIQPATPGADLCLRLRRPDGTSKVGQTCLSGATNPRIDTVIDQSGKHLVIVEEFNGTSAVSYSLTFQCLAGDCVQPTRSCNGETATIAGGDGDNILIGTDQRDVIAGGGGNDLIYGLGGNDLICGDAGSDTIFGGEDGDRIFGGGGSDLLFGEAGNDRLTGAAGNDMLSGGGDDDNLNGGSGTDVCDGGGHIVGDRAADNCESKIGVAP